MSLTLRSPAKINLWLRILKKREDGFHDLETRLCAVDLADTITIKPALDGNSKLSCSNPDLPVDGSNLAMKALLAYQAVSGIAEPWHIHLEKVVPHGAGLGGGSSNAASVLLGLNQLHQQALSDATLHEIAAKLGSDVPFFLYRRACDASGRGDLITPLEEFHWELPLVLIKPSFGISTPWAYQNWQSSKEMAGVNYAPQVMPWGEMVNHLERPVFEKWSWLPTMKNWLQEQPETKAALMSGSGSTIFAISETGEQAEVLAAKVRKLCQGGSTWVQVTKTLTSWS